MIEIETIRLSFPDWDWWQILIAIAFIAMIFQGNIKGALQWIESFIPKVRDKEGKD